MKQKESNVARVTGDVYVNNAEVGWIHEGIDEPMDTRMTFTFRRDESHTNGWCIFQLHSPKLPGLSGRGPESDQ